MRPSSLVGSAEDQFEQTGEIVVRVVADGEEPAPASSRGYADVGAEALAKGVLDALHVGGCSAALGFSRDGASGRGRDLFPMPGDDSLHLPDRPAIGRRFAG